MTHNNVFYKINIFILLLIGLGSCTTDQVRNLSSSPLAMGTTNEIVVIADKNVWEGRIGDSLRYYFEAPYLILPQPEPIFDLRHFTTDDLSDKPLRKHLRTFLFVGDLQDQDSPMGQMIKQDLRSENVRRAKEDPTFVSTVGKNKWAQGQLVVYLFGFGEEAMIQNIRKSFPAIARRITSFDKKQIDNSTYAMGTSRSLSETVKNEMGFNIKLPNEYTLAIHEGDFMWLRRESDKASNNIMFYKIPYTDASQLTEAGLKKIRDELGKQYITTDIEDTYMRINDVDLPLYSENIKINGAFALETRGIWEIENDFMGGAFISYLFLNEKTNELIFADGFVHAPGEEKRDYMQFLAHIFSSISF